MGAPLQARGQTPLQAMVRAALKFAEDTDRPSEGEPQAEYERALHAFEQALFR